jgi:hypothetical protein
MLKISRLRSLLFSMNANLTRLKSVSGCMVGYRPLYRYFQALRAMAA